MSLSDKTRKALEKIGLTSYEIKVYSALLKTGQINASDLSQKSSVTYSKLRIFLNTEDLISDIDLNDSRQIQYLAKRTATAIESSGQYFESDFKYNEYI